MPSLSRPNDRFSINFEIIENGSGTFRGIITEPGQGDVPTYQFNLPRRLLRVTSHLPITAGMVVKDLGGTVFVLANHGASESRDEELFRNFRMFEAPKKYTWQTRGKETDVVTKLQRDTGLIDQPDIWGCYEPTPESFDRGLRTSVETGRFITNKQINRDDMVDGRKVTRVDDQLGIYLATLG